MVLLHLKVLILRRNQNHDMFSHITKDFLGNVKSYSIGVVFIALGTMIGSWATFIPFVKQSFTLDDAKLGILLLSLPLGALSMNPVAAALVRKLGMQKATLSGYILVIVAFGALLNISNLWLFAFGLYICGTSIAITNVAMNTCVNAIEHKFHIKIMSTCHGMFSLGLMLGSIGSSFFGGMGVVPGFYMLGFSAIMVVAFFFIKNTIITIEDEVMETSPDIKMKRFAFPTGNFLLMIIIGVCINITEGSMTDWTAVYMRDIVHTNRIFEGWGLAGYSFFMAIGRFSGDKIIPRFGPNNILIYGGGIAVLGLLIAIFLPYTFTSILGFALVGAGVSCGAPILYASAARVPNMAKGSGLALMNTFAMGGFLFGPVLIGFISESLSLPIAFGIISILAAVWVYTSKKVTLF